MSLNEPTENFDEFAFNLIVAWCKTVWPNERIDGDDDTATILVFAFIRAREGESVRARAKWNLYQIKGAIFIEAHCFVFCFVLAVRHKDSWFK